MKVSERLIHSLQTERGLSIVYGESKEFFQHALDVDKSTKNRKSVIAAITKHI